MCFLNLGKSSVSLCHIVFAPFQHCSLVNMCVFVLLPGLGVEGATDQAGRSLGVNFSHLHRAAKRVFNRGDLYFVLFWFNIVLHDVLLCVRIG